MLTNADYKKLDCVDLLGTACCGEFSVGHDYLNQKVLVFINRNGHWDLFTERDCADRTDAIGIAKSLLAGEFIEGEYHAG